MGYEQRCGEVSSQAAASPKISEYHPSFTPANSGLLQRWFRGGVLSATGGEQKQIKDELLMFVQGGDIPNRGYETQGIPNRGYEAQESLGLGSSEAAKDPAGKNELGDREGGKEDMDGERSFRARPWTKVWNASLEVLTGSTPQELPNAVGWESLSFSMCRLKYFAFECVNKELLILTAQLLLLICLLYLFTTLRHEGG